MQLTDIEIATAVVFLALQIADVWTTIVGMNSGAVESNPVVKWMMDTFGKTWVLIKITGASLGAYLAWSEGAIWIVWAICAVMAYVVWQNHRIIKNRKRK